MTNFLRDSSQRRITSSRDTRSPRAYAVFALLILIAFLLFGPHILSESVVAFARPLWGVEAWVMRALAPVTASWANATELKEENRKLSHELYLKSLEIQRLNLVLQEYTEIAQLFGDDDPTRKNLPGGTIATIAARPPTSPFDTLVLTVRQDSGVQNTDLIYAPGGILLGEIREVYPTISKAILYTAPDEEHHGFIKDTGPITLRGMGNGNFIGELPKSHSLPPGTLILKEGGDSILAQVGTTTRREGDANQKVYARVPINIQSLQWVYIVHHE